MAVDYYLDTNDTIYASERNTFASKSAATWSASNYVYIGLDDLTGGADLSGQSSLFVNKVELKAQIQGLPPSSGPAYSYGTLLAGVVPKDKVATVEFKSFKSYEDYLSWPLKGSKKLYYVNGELSTIWWTSSCTYKPRRALLINRNQVLVFAIYNEFGVPVSGALSMVCQFKRGQ